MLDLDQLRERAALLGDETPTTVSGRFMRQVIKELSEARAARANALDYNPGPVIRGDVEISADLSRASGAFTALVKRAGGKVISVTPV
ncbi:hypothetical protein LH128_07617 [Sphingomonas sp. LH128]|uniref:hypothetical protein n=1 Tax=Sphingomonas sp. LH128 TaxID=473781 RepID=UPI00027CC4E9|nr:hypothetical protein [Sphingomonas sp. LH128]EJU13664.1 hypothetical protein LH128_07617 [Sphingomonas sp. LH128]